MVEPTIKKHSLFVRILRWIGAGVALLFGIAIIQEIITSIPASVDQKPNREEIKNMGDPLKQSSPPSDSYAVALIDESDAKQIDVYIAFSARQTDTSQVKKILKTIADSCFDAVTERNPKFQNQVAVWVYNTIRQASEKELKSSYTATILINRETGFTHYQFSNLPW